MTNREILLELLQITHDRQDWFVPLKAALRDLTPEQAKWKDGRNHSVEEVVHHLLFWNERHLDQFQGKKPAGSADDNEQTFHVAGSWRETVQRVDDLIARWTDAIQQASDDHLASEASRITHLASHNAYHAGQILYIRKSQGIWDPDKGVR